MRGRSLVLNVRIYYEGNMKKERERERGRRGESAYVSVWSHPFGFQTSHSSQSWSLKRDPFSFYVCIKVKLKI